MQQLLTTGARLTHAAAIATDLLPAMLGEDGQRRYLLAFQNNAEPRATGGLVGNVSLLKADHGQLSIGRATSPYALENGRYVAPQSDEERFIFSTG